MACVGIRYTCHRALRGQSRPTWVLLAFFVLYFKTLAFFEYSAFFWKIRRLVPKKNIFFCKRSPILHYYPSTAIKQEYNGNNTTRRCDRQDGGSTGEEEEEKEEVPWGRRRWMGSEWKKADDHWRARLVAAVKQKKTTTMMITVNDLAFTVEWRSTLQGSINDNNKNNNKDGPDGIWIWIETQTRNEQTNRGCYAVKMPKHCTFELIICARKHVKVQKITKKYPSSSLSHTEQLETRGYMIIQYLTRQLCHNWGLWKYCFTTFLRFQLFHHDWSVPRKHIIYWNTQSGYSFHTYLSITQQTYNSYNAPLQNQISDLSNDFFM